MLSGVRIVNVIHEMVLQAVKGDDLKEVYPSFDAVPVIRKSSRLFVVVGLERMQTETIIPNSQNGVVPFTAFFRISIVGNYKNPLSLSEDFFFQTVFPRMTTVGAVICEVLPASADTKLQKTLFSAVFSVKGFLSEGVTG